MTQSPMKHLGRNIGQHHILLLSTLSGGLPGLLLASSPPNTFSQWSHSSARSLVVGVVGVVGMVKLSWRKRDEPLRHEHQVVNKPRV